MQALSLVPPSETTGVPDDYRSGDGIFFLRVETDLYVNRNLSAGNLLIVEPRDRLSPRDIVVVRRSNGELALRSGEAIEALEEMLALLPPLAEAPEEPDEPEVEDEILGIVVGVMKKF